MDNMYIGIGTLVMFGLMWMFAPPLSNALFAMIDNSENPLKTLIWIIAVFIVLAVSFASPAIGILLGVFSLLCYWTFLFLRFLWRCIPR